MKRSYANIINHTSRHQSSNRSRHLTLIQQQSYGTRCNYPRHPRSRDSITERRRRRHVTHACRHDPTKAPSERHLAAGRLLTGCLSVTGLLSPESMITCWKVGETHTFTIVRPCRGERKKVKSISVRNKGT